MERKFVCEEFKIGEKGAYVRWKTFEYGKIYRLGLRLLEQVESDPETDVDEYDELMAVVILFCSSLECFVNDMLILHANRAYGSDYKAIAEGLLGGSLRSKIVRVVPILSRSTKKLDHQSASTLFEMIRTRNRVTHTTEYYREGTIDEFQFHESSAPRPTAGDCIRYAEAVGEFFDAVLSGEPSGGANPWEHSSIKRAQPD